MEKLDLAQSFKVFQMLFREAQHEMFKAEVLQDYSAVDNGPSLQAWLDPREIDPAKRLKRAQELWESDKDTITYREMCLASRAEITRIHVVEEPYTEYLKWEIAVCYEGLLISGAENVLLAPRRKIPGVQFPKGDFWRFDNTFLQWEYDQRGKTSGARVWTEGQGKDVDHFRHLEAVLRNAAEPIK